MCCFLCFLLFFVPWPPSALPPPWFLTLCKVKSEKRPQNGQKSLWVQKHRENKGAPKMAKIQYGVKPDIFKYAWICVCVCMVGPKPRNPRSPPPSPFPPSRLPWWANTGWGHRVGVPKGGGPAGVGLRRVGPRRLADPKFRAFFPSPASIFLFFSLSGGLLVEFSRLKRRVPEMCTFGVLGLSCEALEGPQPHNHTNTQLTTTTTHNNTQQHTQQHTTTTHTTTHNNTHNNTQQHTQHTHTQTDTHRQTHTDRHTQTDTHSRHTLTHTQTQNRRFGPIGLS